SGGWFSARFPGRTVCYPADCLLANLQLENQPCIEIFRTELVPYYFFLGRTRFKKADRCTANCLIVFLRSIFDLALNTHVGVGDFGLAMGERMTIFIQVDKNELIDG